MERPLPAYEGPEPFIFVCYAHDDAALVYPEITRLSDAGFNVWYDEGISPGSEWSATLAAHIQECAVFLYFITPRSVDREHCRREVNFALEQRCTILPVHLEETDIPAALQLNLSHRQAILKYQFPARAYHQKLDRALESAASGRTALADEKADQVLQIGDWTLETGSQRLTRDDTAQTLDPKDLSVLLHLAESAPDLVTTEALLERSWPGVVVGDNALHQVIGRLRRALGDNARKPEYIETLSKRGYRLMVDVTRRSADGADETAVVAQSNEGAVESLRSKSRINSRAVTFFLLMLIIAALTLVWLAKKGVEDEEGALLGLSRVAVMDVADLSPSSDLAWLSGGLARQLHAQLSLFDQQHISVVPFPLSRGDVSDLPPETTHVITGSVTPTGDKGVVVTLELTDLRDAEQIWTRSFSGSIENPLELQLNIAAQVAKFTGRTAYVHLDGPKDPHARSAYLKYVHYQYGLDPDQEFYWLEQALAQDTDWLNGWIELTFLNLWEADSFLNEEALHRARASLERVHQLSGGSDFALFLEGWLQLREGAALSQVEQLFLTGARKNSYYWRSLLPYALLMWESGLDQEARSFFEYVVQMDPFGPTIQWLVHTRSLTGDIHGAMELTLRHARFFQHSFQTRFPLAHLLPESQRMEEARVLLDELELEIAQTKTGDRRHSLSKQMAWVLQLNMAWYSNDTSDLEAMAGAWADEEEWLAALLFSAAAGSRKGDEYSRRVVDELPVRPLWGALRALFPAEVLEEPAVARLGTAWGYTDEWRLELCLRAAELPPEAHLTCNPADYE